MVNLTLKKNNFSSDTLRRVIIGVILSIFIIGIWITLSSRQNPKIISDITFDSEVVPLPPLESTSKPPLGAKANTPSPPPSEEVEQIAEQLSDPVSNNDNARYYPFFATFKAPLNSDQRASLNGDKPVLSIILSGAGQSRRLNDQIIEKLSNNVSLSVSPYLHNHNEIATAFSDRGFEIWMDAASITLDMNNDHGSLALNPANNFENNIALLTRQLDNKDKLTGIVLKPRSLIIETDELWSSIVNDLFAEGYGIVDNTAQVMKPSLFFYEDRRAPYIKGDQVLDETMPLTDFRQALSNVRKSVKEQGRMIVTIPVTSPATLDILVDWVNTLPTEGITLVPVSAQAKL